MWSYYMITVVPFFFLSSKGMHFTLESNILHVNTYGYNAGYKLFIV